MDTFLRLNGVLLSFTNEESYRPVIRTVEGELSKDEVAEMLQSDLQE